jgi:hypothetical protein
MKPGFTDEHRYPRGYVRSDCTNVANTRAVDRNKMAQDERQPEGKVRMLPRMSKVSILKVETARQWHDLTAVEEQSWWTRH